MEYPLQSLRSFWYTRFQGGLFLLALLTYGLGDAITAAFMIEKHGLMREGNIIVRYIISNFGISNFIEIKIWFTFLILLAPFLIVFRSREPNYWMINGYLSSFIAGGTLAIVLNLQAAANQPLILQSEHVILIFISLVIILTNIGELIDNMTTPIIISYFYCGINDLSIILKFMSNIHEKRKPDISG